VLNFAQEDLVSEDVMLLDVGDTLFVWLGLHSNQQEKSAALENAREYLEYDPSDRDKDIAITLLKQGYEPPSFTGFFGAWDRKLFVVRETTIGPRWSKTNILLLVTLSETYFQEPDLPVIHKPEVVTNGSSSSGSHLQQTSQNGVRFYRIEVLNAGDQIPSDVDANSKEASGEKCLWKYINLMFSCIFRSTCPMTTLRTCLA
jgi:hypothetical protein